ncbi:MAG TPA: response regulator, partial [Acidimicrobiales bacterium]|nr:response regulator [Acidimicrobiales bacterium]
AEAAVPADGPAPAPEPHRQTEDAAGLRVLVAEDNPVNQRVVLLFLERLGHQAEVVPDGQEVLRALEMQTYDVVLMDMRMPEMDGLEATRLIRRRWPDGRPQVVGVTANAVAGDRAQCLASGMDGYLSKPFSMEELAEVLSGLRPMAGAD